jgi:hypothetical protein
MSSNTKKAQAVVIISRLGSPSKLMPMPVPTTLILEITIPTFKAVLSQLPLRASPAPATTRSPRRAPSASMATPSSTTRVSPTPRVLPGSTSTSDSASPSAAHAATSTPSPVYASAAPTPPTSRTSTAAAPIGQWPVPPISTRPTTPASMSPPPAPPSTPTEESASRASPNYTSSTSMAPAARSL